MQNPMAALLKIRNLTVRFPAARAAAQTAVDNVCLEIGPAEILGLMGESGCGKTTLCMALLGLLAKEDAEVSGSVVFREKELIDLDERSLQTLRGAKISLVPQEPGIALSPVLRVGDQIAEVLHAHRNWTWDHCRAEAESWLARVGLLPIKRIFDSFPHQLSGGQLQRVVLAQALACEPEIIIADEPTASLDALTQSSFLALLHEMKTQLGISVLLISHSAQVQASLADRLLVMKEGRIVREERFEQIRREDSDACKSVALGLNLPGSADAGSEREPAVEEPVTL
jgi:ABC-type glutathione transport system ATPase component